MTIEVTTHDRPTTRVDGSGWTVDEDGHLHIYASGADKAKAVASFAAGTWFSVAVSDPKNR